MEFIKSQLESGLNLRQLNHLNIVHIHLHAEHTDRLKRRLKPATASVPSTLERIDSLFVLLRLSRNLAVETLIPQTALVKLTTLIQTI